MAIRNDIFTQLSNNATVSNIVGSRIYFAIDTGSVHPSCIIELAREVDNALNKSDLQRYNLVITCVALDQTTAASLGDAVYKCLNRSTFGAVKSILLSDASEQAISDTGDVDRIYFTAILSFSVLSGED